MDAAFCQHAEEVAAHFHIDPSKGLSDDDVTKARLTHGRNEFEPEEGTPLWKLVLKQFDDTLVKILLIAAVVDLVIALSDGESFLRSLVEPMVIVLILVANAIVGVVTERNAEQAIEELKAYEAESAAVLRNGQLRQVAAAELVPGDVVEVAVGAKIPADIRLIAKYSSVLRVDQSILTGESGSVDKSEAVVASMQAVLQDKTNILFSGTMVTNGRGRGIVIGTGSSTAIGQIRGAMQEQEEGTTPLKKKLDEFGTLLSRVIAAICVLVWVINIKRFADPALGGWWHGAVYYFKIAVALAVAAIPEGLPAVVTTCLALGTRKMAARNAIVRTLPAVETLGCTTVICTDKTGTLTTNQMSVVCAAIMQAPSGALSEFEVTGNTFSPEGRIMSSGGAVLRQPSDVPALLQLAMAGATCNDSTLACQTSSGGFERGAGVGSKQHVGEATELALRVFAEKVGLPHHLVASPRNQQSGWPCNSYWEERYQRMSTVEFSRDRKMMSVLCGGDGRTMLFAKGAPESILERCSTVLVGSGEGAVPLTPALKAAALEAVHRYGSSRALRCLALASKPMPKDATQASRDDEGELTFLGIVAMHDPPRQECRSAVATCRQAGIRVVMVTGDNAATAAAVAKHVGILEAGDGGEGGMFDPEAGEKRVITGAEFDALPPSAQLAAASEVAVFSRVEPLHKLRLVELFRAQGQVVAMTGDGVNDAPALMRADIGVAMGSGTAVAKGAADMVLADDNFATIVAAVAEGRAIYANTKQFIRYMISSNIGEVVAIFVAALLGIPEVLTPVQLLWVNLVTDGLPATALGFNRPDGDLMQQRPRSTSDGIVNGWLFVRYLLVGLYVGLVTVYGFAWWFVSFQDGPHISWSDLAHFQTCAIANSHASAPAASTPPHRALLATPAAAHPAIDCSIFASLHPKTISMTVLVVVEMFNALNALSENCSLLTLPPWSNRWLLGAISLSVSLHLAILYIPPAAALFGVTALSWAEWRLVLLVSAPVILVDEVLKLITRRYHPELRRWKRASPGGKAPASKGGYIALSTHEGGYRR